MYVYVRMYMYVYVRMYMCMYVFVHDRLSYQMYVRMYVGHRCMAFSRVMCVTCDMIPSMPSPYIKSLFYLCTYVRMYVCMYAHPCVCVCVRTYYVCSCA